MEWLSIPFKLLLSPASEQELYRCYGAWITLFLVVNTIWDYRSVHTAEFYLKNIITKIDQVFYATTFASGVLLISSLFQAEIKVLVAENPIYVTISGFVCLLHGAAGISPVKKRKPKPKALA